VHVPFALNQDYMVQNVQKPSALVQNYVQTGEPLVTPDQTDKLKKDTQRNGRRAMAVTKKRNTVVAIASADNGVGALAAELQLESYSAMPPATLAQADIITTTDDNPTSQPVSKRQRITNVSLPVVLPIVPVETGPPQKKCQGCIHIDLLEMNVMEPAHIKHYLKEGEYLELATCEGNCKLTIREIHLAAPKANIYYCDESNKGFYAPDDDSNKADMECGLILCSPCHAIREERYTLETSKSGFGTRRNRRRGN
jgi:hypothetical protein